MSTALQTLLQHNKGARDRALLALQAGQQRLQALRDQGQQLQDYRNDTQARDPARNGRSTGMDSLLTHRSFMQRLQQALDLQQSQIDHAQLMVQALQADLQACELRLAQVQKLQERRLREVQKRDDRQEQKRSDEAGQQRGHHHHVRAAQAAEAAAHAATLAPDYPPLPIAPYRSLPPPNAP